MNSEHAESLKGEIENFKSYISTHQKKIYGDGFGEISLRDRLENYLEDILNKNEILLKVISLLSDEVVREYSQALREINSQFSSLISYQAGDFIRSRDGHLNNIIQNHNKIFKIWGSVFAVYQQYYPNELLKAVDSLDSKLGKIDEIVGQAETAAQASISTAQGLSFASVQKIWRDSKNGMAWKMLANAILLLLAIFFFLKYAMCFLEEVNSFDDKWTWKIVYLASIRFVILGFLIAVVHFLVSTLRSYMHLYESSLHKLNITNAIPVFHESVADLEKDKIFFRLLDGLMQFNETGFLKSEFKGLENKLPTINIGDKKTD